MAIPFLTRKTAEDFTARLSKIQASDRPKFGVLTPVKLMRHLRFTFDMSLEKVKVHDISNFFTRTVIRILAFHWFTNWPGGKIKAPDELTPEPDGDFEQERGDMIAAINEFLVEADKNPTRKTLSPLLGQCTLKYWRRIHGLHLRHHCKQYGV